MSIPRSPNWRETPCNMAPTLISFLPPSSRLQRIFCANPRHLWARSVLAPGPSSNVFLHQHPTNVKCLRVFPSLQLLDNATLQQVLHFSWPSQMRCPGWVDLFLLLHYVVFGNHSCSMVLRSMCLQNPKQEFITLRWKSSKILREVLKKHTENNPWQGLNSSESMISHPLRSCQDNLDFHANPRALKIQHRKRRIGGNWNLPHCHAS